MLDPCSKWPGDGGVCALSLHRLASEPADGSALPLHMRTARLDGKLLFAPCANLWKQHLEGR